MPTDQVIQLLRQERDKIDAALRLLEGTGKRIGRPRKTDANVPEWVGSTSAAPATKKRGRRYSAAQKKAQSLRMKAQWAARKKAEGRAGLTKKTAKVKSATAKG